MAAGEFLELLGARTLELEGDDGLAGIDLTTLKRGPGVAQVRAGDDHFLFQRERLLLGTGEREHRPRGVPGGPLRQRLAPCIHELQQRGLADDPQGPLGIFDPREFHNDAPLALALDRRFDHAELVDAVADDLHRRIHGLRCDLQLFRVLRLQDDVAAALQVQAQVDLQAWRLEVRSPAAEADGRSRQLHRRQDHEHDDDPPEDAEHDHPPPEHKKRRLRRRRRSSDRTANDRFIIPAGAGADKPGIRLDARAEPLYH
mgnify:CR=1 FL=1